MRVVESITENEVIATFLEAEINSERFSDCIHKSLKRDKVSKTLITNPDLQNRKENGYRKKLLGECRGFGENKLLFDGFPQDVEWFTAKLTRGELERIKYIDYSYWVELTDNSRLAKDAVRSIRAGKEIFGESNERFLKAADSLSRGVSFPKMILVGKDKDSYLVVLEGHLRLTAYMLNPERIPDELEVIVGLSKNITKWGFY